MKLFGYTIPQIRKAVVAFIGTVLTVLAFLSTDLVNLLPEGAANTIGTVIAVLTVVSVFLVKNGDTIDDLADGRFDGRFTPR